jgi:hypothetical protein
MTLWSCPSRMLPLSLWAGACIGFKLFAGSTRRAIVSQDSATTGKCSDVRWQGAATVTTSKPATTSRGHFAFVVGNNNYVHEKPLDKCENDARDIGVLLRAGGYKVTTTMNATKKR